MAVYFIGNYKGDLHGSSLILGTNLLKTLYNHGISSLYLSRDLFGGRGKLYRFICASPKNEHGSFDIEVEVKDGRIKIPKGMIEYADLGQNKTSIVGMRDDLEIWNTETIKDITKKPLTKRQMLKVSKILTEASERESEDFLSDTESEHD